MVRCNKCGKEIIYVNDIPREDYLHVKKDWGYFSKKDGKIYEFNLCEACVDQMVGEFNIPVTVCDNNELL